LSGICRRYQEGVLTRVTRICHADHRGHGKRLARRLALCSLACAALAVISLGPGSGAASAGTAVPLRVSASGSQPRHRPSCRPTLDLGYIRDDFYVHTAANPSRWNPW